jgi:hypothetical protein
LVSKDIGNGSTRPNKPKLALKKRQQNELNTASKARVSEQMGVTELNTIKRDSKVLVPPKRGKRLNTTSKLKCAKLPLEKISQLPLIKCIVKHQSNKENSPPCLTSAHNKNQSSNKSIRAKRYQLKNLVLQKEFRVHDRSKYRSSMRFPMTSGRPSTSRTNDKFRY